MALKDREIIVISGGSSYLLTFLKIIKNLDRDHLWPKNPKILIGTSAGAIVATVLNLSMGNEISQIDIYDFDIKLTSPMWKMIYNLLVKGYLNDTVKLREFLILKFNTIFRDSRFPLFETITFKQLHQMTKKLLIINTVDIDSSLPFQMDAFMTPDIKIIDAIIASTANWVYLSPFEVKVNGEIHHFADGGLSEPFNLKALESSSVARMRVSTKPSNLVGIQLIDFYPSKEHPYKGSKFALYNYYDRIGIFRNRHADNQTYLPSIIQFEGLPLSSIQLYNITPSLLGQLVALADRVSEEVEKLNKVTGGKIINPLFISKH